VAHEIRIKVVPHRNGNGELSLTTKDYVVIDRTRGRTVTVGVRPSMKKAIELREEHRVGCFATHLSRNPNDAAFLHKHDQFLTPTETSKRPREDRSRGWRMRLGDKYVQAGIAARKKLAKNKPARGSYSTFAEIDKESK
jgi:hypothetical protein